MIYINREIDMKTILLSNIGNRNIKYKGETFDFKKHDKDFRTWTKNLLDNFLTEKEFLEINIINNLLDEIISETSTIILFASNQVNEMKKDQDTLFEAQIMKNLIEEKYFGVEVKIEEIPCKVTDNDELLRRYRSKLKNYKQIFSEHHFVICDAGGTPQQKSALKIMTEFILEESSFEVRYVNPNGVLEPVKQIEYRKIIVSEQIKILIDKGEYRAALELWGITDPTDNKSCKGEFEKLLCYAYFRFNHQHEKVSEMSFKVNFLEKNNEIMAYIQKNTPIVHSEWKDIMSQESLFLLGEHLETLFFRWQKRQFNECILSLSVLYEFYLHATIEHKFGYKLTNSEKFSNEESRLIDVAKQKFTNVAMAYPDKIIKGVPFFLVVAENIEFSSSQKFLKILKKHLSTGSNWKFSSNDSKTLGINTVRNKIAHNGKYVDQKFVNEYMPYLLTFMENTFEIFEIEESYFNSLNQQIIALL